MKTVRCFANEDGEIKRYEERLDAIYGLNKREAFAYAASTWANNVSREENGNARNCGSVGLPIERYRVSIPNVRSVPVSQIPSLLYNVSEWFVSVFGSKVSGKRLNGTVVLEPPADQHSGAEGVHPVLRRDTGHRWNGQQWRPGCLRTL